jgi:hypothetical protein
MDLIPPCKRSAIGRDQQHDEASLDVEPVSITP